LFRIVEASTGCIRIDGHDISAMGLRQLRRSMAIIPQDALLLRGTVRHNLDPFSCYETAELVRVLQAVGMPASMLKREVSTSASGLSAGERQLICFARTLMRKVKIVVMDEPTANIDMVTDEKMQLTVRKHFKDLTVLTIAHRLNTIIDYDKILVMDSGHVAEFGSAATLLQNRDGHLSRTVKAMGQEAAQLLHEKAVRKRKAKELGSLRR